jgi:DNA-3-methyladenine glycosylase II
VCAFAVRQEGDRLLVSQAGDQPESRVRAHVERVLSLDVDDGPLAEVAERDPVVRSLVERFPGKRLVCLPSPWEAAAWTVLSQRTSMAQAAGVKRRLVEELGPRVPVDGVELTAFPPPGALAGAEEIPGVAGRRAERLRAVAQAAVDGVLDPAALRTLDTGEAMARLEQIHGIGPFSAMLILGRGAGHPDLPPPAIPPARRAIAEAYGLEEVDADRAREISEGWRPMRTWVLFLLRSG